MRYIQSLASSGAVQTALDEQELGKPYIAYLEDEHRIDWNGLSPDSPVPVYSAMPLTVEVLSSGTLTFSYNNYSDNYCQPRLISVYKNEEYYNQLLLNGTRHSATLNVTAGEILKLKISGSYNGYGFQANYYCTFSGSTAYFNLYGNPMSLLNGSNFTGMTSLSAQRTFQGLFRNTHVVDASNLILPVTGLTAYCYYEMFRNCGDLTSGPELQAQTLANYSYSNMFYGCQNLSQIKCLATNISATNCISSWLNNVSVRGTFIKHPNMTSWPSGANGIPAGWTVVDADI